MESRPRGSPVLAKLGCRVVFGGADFENPSRVNPMACGFGVAYTTAIWRQRPETMPS